MFVYYNGYSYRKLETITTHVIQTPLTPNNRYTADVSCNEKPKY